MKYYLFDEEGVLQKFDVERFLKDYYTNLEILSSLEEEEKEFRFMYGTSREPKVQTSKISNNTENLALLYFNIQNRIEKYRAYFRTYNRAMEAMPEDDRALLKLFYLDKHIHPLTKAMIKFGISKSEVYRRREKALKHFSSLVVGDDI